jgi:hypothetical protein
MPLDIRGRVAIALAECAHKQTGLSRKCRPQLSVQTRARNFSVQTRVPLPVPGCSETPGAAGRRPHGRGPALLLVAVLIATVLAAVAAPAARASAGAETLLQDDMQLLYSGADRRDETLDELKKLGVDSVRVFVSWNALAPAARSTSRPSFNASDPAAYSSAEWARYDGLVRSAARRGLGVLFTPTGPIPAWASQCTGSVQRRRLCSPDPAEFGRFVTALGTRYSGGYAGLPRVSRWAIWNEPNVAIWLLPQYVSRGGRLIPVSAWRYRDLVRAAVRALRATGHGGDQIMAGETGPIGQSGGSLSRRPVATAQFLRTVFCVSPSGGPLRSAAVGCTGRYEPLGLSAISHHPYIQGGSRPPRTPARSDEITISSPGRLKSILAAAARLGRIRPGLPIYYTEYGFQTDPPDRLLGVPLALQAQYLAESLYMTYRDPRVRGLTQYLLRDDAGLPGFQTGLRFNDGRPKPSLRDFPFSVFVSRHGGVVTVFAQLRAAPDGAAIPVQVQRRAPAGRQFETLRTVTTNPKGFLLVRLRSPRSVWRLQAGPQGGGLTSRIAQEAIR